MTAVLAAALALPLLGALGAVLVRRVAVAPLATAAAALGWAVVAAADEAPELGSITATPTVAAAAAGAAVLAAAWPPGTALGRSAASCAVTVLAVGASIGDPGLPDRPLAVAVLVVAALAGLVAWSERPGAGDRFRLATVAVPCGGAATGLGLLFGAGAPAGVLVGAGAVVVVAGAARFAGPAPVLVPAAALAAFRVAEADAGSIAVASAAVGICAAGLLLADAFWPHDGRSATGHGGPRTRGFGLSVVAAAVVLVVQDVPGLAGAALLLAAGGVLAAAAEHPLGLVAALPGLTAVLEAMGQATGPEPAVAAIAALGFLALAVAGTDLASPRPSSFWPAPAVVFGLVPLWGWSGATPEGHVDGVATAAAVAAVLLAGGLALTAGVPTALTPGAGKLARRPRAEIHASSHPLVEADEPEAVGAEVPEGTPRRRRAASAQRPLAVPSRPVPGRTAAGGVGGRGRLRARPGRPA